MHPHYLLCTIFILFNLSNYVIKGENATNTTGSSLLTSTTTIGSLSTSVVCPEGYKLILSGSECQINSEPYNTTIASVKNQEHPLGGRARRLFLIFVGCALTIFVIITLIMTYNRVTAQHNRHSSANPTIQPTIGNRFHNILQSLSFNNLRKNARLNFFSVSNNNYSSGINRQGETSRAHLNENQDEALLFDDPYADGGISSGLHGSSANPYKSLTLSVT